MLKPLPEEESLRAELARACGALAHMQEVGRLGTWTRDETTGAVEWSDGLIKLLGLGPEIEPSLEAWLDMVHPDDRPRVIATIVAGLAQGPGYEYECRIRVAARSGSSTWTHA